MKGAPRSDQFDDVYFSVDDGLAETRHVFMQGNGLPDFWQGKDTFTIVETGFGTGLNFLCAWKGFVDTTDPKQRLDFVSFEKFPLSASDVEEALKPWEEELGEYTQKLIDNYPIRIGGFHRIVFDDRVALTLIFGDVNEYILELHASVNCWFLDGFTPAKNPDMWSKMLFQNMARLSLPHARFATFTAAGDVKRGLQAAGFNVTKTNGFGRKRDMLVGFYDHGTQEVQSSCPKKVAVIGGGLAGTACAYTLKQYGFEPVIYEAANNLASGASGNQIGLFNTRFAALRDTESEFFNSAYAQIIRTAQKANAIDYYAAGTLHLVNNETKGKRYDKMLKNWHWHDDHIKLLSKEQASDVAGVELDYMALYLPDAGALCPAKLCSYYARDIEVYLNHKVDSLSDIEADAYVLANAFGIKDLADQALSEIDGFPVYNVRGQVSLVDGGNRLKNLKANICYGGYVSTNAGGQQVVGSTFKKWMDHTDILNEDDQENIDYLKEEISSLSDETISAVGSRAGMRLSSRDHFPIVGKIPGTENVYSCVAFGSHGIVCSIAAAHLIADQLRGGPYSLPERTVKQLNAQRFISRERKKNFR